MITSGHISMNTDQVRKRDLPVIHI